MRTVVGYPPNFAAIKARLRVSDRTVYAYGDVLYCGTPANRAKVTPDLLAHEAVHSRQQAHLVGGPVEWWERYLDDAAFRLEQEVEAYRAQYAHVAACEPRAVRRKYLDYFSATLSGPLYGRIVSRDAARSLIQHEHLPVPAFG